MQRVDWHSIVTGLLALVVAIGGWFATMIYRLAAEAGEANAHQAEQIQSLRERLNSHDGQIEDVRANGSRVANENKLRIYELVRRVDDLDDNCDPRHPPRARRDPQ